MADPGPEAAYYESAKGGAVKCLLCPQGCVIKEGATGTCRTRTNSGGKLALLNYGRFTSLAMDPIEKKPLYHFFPGRDVLSIGGKGCNFECAFCQNSGISQGDPQVRSITTGQLAAETKNCSSGNVGLAFTYNEPFIWFEFIRDTAPLIRDNGQKIVLVTNGFVNPEPLEELLPLIDAMNIDLKAFDDEFYKKYCGGKIDPVKNTIETSVKAGVHVEVTLLVIPSLNDDMKKIDEQAGWLASLSEDIPLHLSRYFPNYKLDIAPTPAVTMIDACEAASGHLNYVYLGNMGDPEFLNTKCPGCGAELIRRRGYSTDVTGLDGDRCAGCGRTVAVIN